MSSARDFAEAARLHQDGRLDAAAAQYRRIPPGTPEFPHALHMLGLIARGKGDPAGAIDLISRAVQRLPDFPRVHHNLGDALLADRRFPAAETAFRRAVELDDGMASAWHGLGRTLAIRGRTEEAISCFRRCTALDPDHIGARQALVGAGETDQIEELQRILRDHPLPEPNRIAALFALGSALDQAGRFDEAFAAVDEANRLTRAALVRTGQGFDAAELRNYVDRRIAACSPHFFQQFAGYGSPSEMPVFVVGMPRSGTTLVERILASHAAAAGIGESHRIGALVGQLNQAARSAAYGDWDPWHLTRIAEVHLADLRACAPDALRVVDKTPDNVFHLAAIAALFPRARVIFCRRDPRDTCVSAWFQNFDLPMPYSNDLGDCAIRASETDRLIDHWMSVLPSSCLIVQYEALVADPEAETRRLIEFLGLDWDPACLQAHRSGGDVTSSSLFQVRRPVYTGSVGRWSRYRQHLGPLLDAFGRD
ncbi:MAG: sulfotransferase [Acetobacteraceae bacterium]